MLKHQLRLISGYRRNHTAPSFVDGVRQRFDFRETTLCINNLFHLDTSTKVILNGWIDKKPKKIGKNLIFGTLRDTKGDLIQLVDSDALLKSSNVEDVVQIEGSLRLKKSKEDSSNRQLEIQLSSLRTLNSAGKKPSQSLDFKMQGNYPPDLRYLQLRHPKYQGFLRKRHEIVRDVRELLNSFSFTEIETPILFKSTPEGAREFLVPTRTVQNEKPAFYALPQSPQQYKQLLMASGVQRYYQIARCFRDEDLRSDRQPEFTQVDLEMAFASAKQVMDVVESIVTNSWDKHSSSGPLRTLGPGNKIVQLTDAQRITKITYAEAMTLYGIDKPDLRFPALKIIDMSEFKAYGTEDKDFPVFEIMVLRNAFKDRNDYDENWRSLSDENQYKFRAPIVVPIDSKAMETKWFEKYMGVANFENPTLMNRYLNLKEGDIICGATRESTRTLFENPTPLGRLRQLVTQNKRGLELYKENHSDVGVWVVDFPLFSPVEKELVTAGKKHRFPSYKTGVYTSTHHPFTMVQLKDLPKLHTNPLQCLGQHYDFVVNGTELGGGSARIHDPKLQDFIFKSILGIKEPAKLFGHLISAFESGTPPHAGFAIGFDRMCAMLCGTENIRDVIAFPKSVSGSDLVVGSPSNVPAEAVKEYNLNWKHAAPQS
ncbi:LADA_0D03642g1_1 [Lachancea dasiensis]|uniref:LADA_0D03642g1_1 n=1 Tax=Lachancea dasiensis TaxID=1072105 RepID=A0A1G4J4U0_9SACH|nr:LADA_0D03642g1_1 [Lachancea dasiensis]